MKTPEKIAKPRRLKAVELAPGRIIFQAHKVAPEPPEPAVEPVRAPQEQYVNLGDLDERTAARLALKCWVRDVRNLGRTHKYAEFKQRRWEEQNAAFDMEVGLVQSIHCRLHEKALAHATGRD